MSGDAPDGSDAGEPEHRDPRAASDDAAGEHAAVRDALDATAADRRRRVLVWRPRRQVAFGRRDERRDGHAAARRIAEDRGYPATRRAAGGHAVVHGGETVAFGVTVPVAPATVAIADRYCTVLDAVRAALGDVGVAAADGEPDGAFCPGDYGIRAPGGGKLVGVAQRVARDAALVSGVVTVGLDGAALACYAAVYDALDLAFDPGAVGDCGGAAPGAVARALRRRLRDVGE